MSSEEFVSLHDFYEGLVGDREMTEDTLWLQCDWFLLPFLFFSGNHSLHSVVVRAMLLHVFSQFGFDVRALLRDGTSSNQKTSCGYTNNESEDIPTPWFKSPCDGHNMYFFVCSFTSGILCRFLLQLYLLTHFHTFSLKI